MNIKMHVINILHLKRNIFTKWDSFALCFVPEKVNYNATYICCFWSIKIPARSLALRIVGGCDDVMAAIAVTSLPTPEVC